MNRLKLSLSTLALFAGLAGAAVADDAVPFAERGTLYVAADGHVLRKTLSDQEFKMLIGQGATPLKAGVIIVMHDHKIYLVEDHKMPDGRMVSQEVMQQASAGFR